MKIVAIAGSNRKGNTLAMVESAVSVVPPDVNVNVIFLGDVNFSSCDGCLQCDEAGTCHYTDDMSKIVDLIKEADGLILASPTRWGLLSGELKTLLDRLNPLAASELLAGKKAIIFTVGQSEKGEDGAESVRQAAKSIKFFCDNSDIDVVGAVYAYGCLESEDAKGQGSKIFNRCKKSFKSLISAIKS